MILRMSGKAYAAIGLVVLGIAATVADMRTPVRIDVGGDTLIINGFEPVAIGARLINRHGKSVWRPGIGYREDSGSIAHVRNDGSVKCSGVGDDVITVAKGELAKTLLVRCRPIRDFSFHSSYTTLRVGGPPKELSVGAIGFDAKPVELLQGRATLTDSTVVRLRGTMVYPLKVGSSQIHFEFSGGLKTEAHVSVSKTVLDTAFAMVPGESRRDTM
jgi:hypothetical protein